MRASTRIAFLGTGLMGGPMARRLLKGGFSLTVWNRTPNKTKAIIEDGANACSTPTEAVKDADVVITMLKDGPVVKDLLFEQGVAESISPGKLFIDMSSIAPAEAREHAKRLDEHKIHYLDAPVSGGTKGAEAGELAIMVGGSSHDFASAEAVFSELGMATHVGPIGAGQLCKLANQIIVAITIGAVSEAFILAGASGADRANVRKALQGGFAASRILTEHGLRMVKRDFEPGGPAKFQTKDLRNALDAAEEAGLNLPVTKKLHELFFEMTSGELSERDHSALLVHLERMNEIAPPEDCTQ